MPRSGIFLGTEGGAGARSREKVPLSPKTLTYLHNLKWNCTRSHRKLGRKLESEPRSSDYKSKGPSHHSTPQNIRIQFSNKSYHIPLKASQIPLRSILHRLFNSIFMITLRSRCCYSSIPKWRDLHRVMMAAGSGSEPKHSELQILPFCSEAQEYFRGSIICIIYECQVTSVMSNSLQHYGL